MISNGNINKIKVKRVVDGDTFIGDDETHYRLASVYAPEACWRKGLDAAKELEKIISGKEIEVVWQRKQLSHGRTQVKIKRCGDHESINDKMRKLIKQNGWD